METPLKRNNNVQAKLLYHTPLGISVLAIRTCRNTVHLSDTEQYDTDEIGPKDKKLISETILAQNKESNKLRALHHSVLEHIYYTFALRYSRSTLQETSRTRIASHSVESTRAFLSFDLNDVEKFEREIRKSPVSANSVSKKLDDLKISYMRKIMEIKKEHNLNNDEIKDCLIEGLMTTNIFTINATSLRNLLMQRTSPRAFLEYQKLAFEMIGCLPLSHLFLYKDKIHFNNKNKLRYIEEIDFE
jgi:thymidylate synthase ThyX